MTPEQQAAAIRLAFYKEETTPKGTELKVAIGKKAHLVILRNEAMDHVAADLILLNAKDGWPDVCGPEWTKEHIEALILKGTHPSAHLPAVLQSLLK